MTKEWTKAEQLLLNAILAASPHGIEECIVSQRKKLFEAHRYKLVDGYRGRYVYAYDCVRFPTLERVELGILSATVAGEPVEVRVFVDGGVIAEIFVTGVRVRSPLRLVVEHVTLRSVASLEGRTATHVATSGWVAELSQRGVLRDLLPAAAPLTRKQRLDELGPLPPEFVELISQTEGARIGQYAVLGISDLLEVRIGDRSIIVLVDMQDEGAIGIIRGQSELRHFEGNDDEGIAVNCTFIEVLERISRGTLFDK